jgi:multifunctional methyltransferase subunit TRM112
MNENLPQKKVPKAESTSENHETKTSKRPNLLPRWPTMKILTLNFLTCARKACKPSPASFPLRPKDAELELVEADMNPAFLANMLPRLEWPALKTVCADLGLPELAADVPSSGELWAAAATAGTTDTAMTTGGETEMEEDEEGDVPAAGQQTQEPSQLAKDLHRLLLETTIQEGKLVCGNCGHEYAIKEGIANFLLPPHLV